MLLELVIISILTSRASSVCGNGDCGFGTATKIAGGGLTERNSRPFQGEVVPHCEAFANALQSPSTVSHGGTALIFGQVALYLRVGTTGMLGFCGGTLLHPEWVVSAAHCCFHDGQLVDHVQAILGAHSLYDRYENGRRIVNVAEVVVHPDWRPDTFANDLALLRLANTLQLTESINTIRLPYLRTAENNFAGLGGTASGWGIAASGVTFISPILREKLMTVMVDPLCNSSFYNQIPENLVCGFSLEAGTCKGDNGGPLTIFFSETQETILLGVTTFISSSGCNDDLPSVFTRVQRYLQWISDVTGIKLD